MTQISTEFVKGYEECLKRTNRDLYEAVKGINSKKDLTGKNLLNAINTVILSLALQQKKVLEMNIELENQPTLNFQGEEKQINKDCMFWDENPFNAKCSDCDEEEDTLEGLLSKEKITFKTSKGTVLTLTLTKSE